MPMVVWAHSTFFCWRWLLASFMISSSSFRFLLLLLCFWGCSILILLRPWIDRQGQGFQDRQQSNLEQPDSELGVQSAIQKTESENGITSPEAE